MRIKNIADTLCILVYYSIIVHVTVRVEDPAETLFTSLGGQYTVHLTVDTILTAKIVGALFMLL